MTAVTFYYPPSKDNKMSWRFRGHKMTYLWQELILPEKRVTKHSDIKNPDMSYFANKSLKYSWIRID